MRFNMDNDEKEKLNKWIKEIRIEDMYFPTLRYIYESTGSFGYSFVVKELTTGKELDLTDIDKF